MAVRQAPSASPLGKGFLTGKIDERLHRLEENTTAADIELTRDDRRAIEGALPRTEGDRYAQAQKRLIDR